MSASKRLSENNSKQLQALQNLMDVSENANILCPSPNPEHPWHTTQFVIRKQPNKSEKSKPNSLSYTKISPKHKRQAQKSPTRLSNSLILCSAAQRKNIPFYLNSGQPKNMNIKVKNMTFYYDTFNSPPLNRYTHHEDKKTSRQGQKQFRKFFALKDKLSQMRIDNEQKKPISYSRYLKERKKQMKLPQRIPTLSQRL